MTVLGSAWILVAPQFDDFGASVTGEADEAGTSAAEAFAASFAEGLDSTKVDADAAGTEAGEAFTEGLGEGLDASKVEADAAGTEAGASYGASFSTEALAGLDTMAASSDETLAATTDAAAAAGAEAGKAYSEALNLEVDKGHEAVEASSAETAEASGGLMSGAMMGTLGAVAALVVVGKKATDVAMQEQTANVQLALAYKNAGVGAEYHTSAVEALDTKMQAFGDNAAETNTALATMIPGTKNSALAMQDMGIAADLAAARQIPFAEAAKMVEKATVGSTTALTRLGIMSTKAAKELKTPAEIMDVLKEKFGGAAEAATHTLGGAMVALKATMDNTLGKVGQVILPVLTSILPLVLPIVAQLGKSLGTIFTAIMPALKAVIPVVASMAKMFGTFLGSALTLAMPLVTMIAKLFAELVPIVAQLLPPLMSLALMQQTLLVPIFRALAPVILDVVTVVVSLASTLIALLVPILKTVFAAITPILPMFMKLLPAILPLVPVIGELVKSLAGLLVPVLNLLLPLVDGVIGILAKLAGILIGVVVDALKLVIGWLTTGIGWLTKVLTPVLTLGSTFGSVFRGIQIVVGKVWNWIESNVISPIEHAFNTVIGGALSGLESLWSSVWGGVQSAVQTVWSVLEPIFNDIGGAISSVVKGIGTITHIGGDLGGIAHKAISWLGTGGLITKPGIFGIAETGPEMVLNPLETSQYLAAKAITGQNTPFLSGVTTSSSGGGHGHDHPSIVISPGAFQVIVSGTNGDVVSAATAAVEKGFDALAAELHGGTSGIRSAR